MRNKQGFKSLLQGMLIGAVILLCLAVACSPKTTARWSGPDYTFNIGVVPDDICYVDGTPKILSANSESDGDYSLVYVRNNGDIVLHQWLLDSVIGITIGDGGEVYWTGAKVECDE